MDKYRIYNIYAIFTKFLNTCKKVAGNLVNELGNLPREGVVSRLSDFKIVALNRTSKDAGTNSESLLFTKLYEYRIEIPNLISSK